MDFFCILELFGGLALFLYGMQLMGDSLKESSSGALKNIMEKMTNNPFKGFLLGLLVTALIQSSNATIIITSGLVTAGIITFKQAPGIIIGANVGTTVTGQIIRLLDIDSSSAGILQLFKPATLAPLALILGMIFIMFCKFNNSRLIGNIAVGFGILFTGLMTMTSSVSVLSDNGVFDSVLTGFSSQPILGFLAGTVVTIIIQSASATIGILQSFSMTGAFTLGSVVPILLGVFLGAAVTTAVICSIGTKAEARRVGMFHVVYSLFKIVLIAIAMLIGCGTGLLTDYWGSTVNPGGIADFNTISNLVCAVISLPLCGFMEKISSGLVKDAKEKTKKYEANLNALDPVFFSTPALAFNSCYEALLIMIESSIKSIKLSMKLLTSYNQKDFEYIIEEERNIDLFADRISNYLVQLSSHIHEDYHIRLMDEYYKVVSEFERLGDHAVNIAEEAADIADKKYVFTENAVKELNVTCEILDNILEYTYKAFEKRDIEAARHIEPLEEVVDDLVYIMKENHLARLRAGKCSMVIDYNFQNILTNIERISDVCSNVGIAVVARVEPELAAEAHKYISRLHKGKDESFNEEYQTQHDIYFAKLEDIPTHFEVGKPQE